MSELDRQFGLTHALASRRLYTDGVEVLYDFADSADDETASALRNLVVGRSGQRVVVLDQARAGQREERERSHS